VCPPPDCARIMPGDKTSNDIACVLWLEIRGIFRVTLISAVFSLNFPAAREPVLPEASSTSTYGDRQ